MRDKVWKIAVCDDETLFLEKIQQLAAQYYSERNIQAEIHCYDNTDAFLQSNLVEYDLILLDMNMQEKNGIEVAKELRSQKIETPIIYISAYIEMAPYGYVVNAFRYLLKNDLEETFCFAMDDVMKELKHHLETIEVRTENVQIELRLTDSNLNHTGIYLYSKGKIMIHLTFDYQSDEGCTTPGQYLRYHRTFQGLTTRELAEKVGVVPATLVLYENDRHPIKHSTAVALANVLGIDRSRLLDEYTVFVDYPYSSLLKKVRRELSFTQMQMAEVIGIGQTTYSGWEREVRVPRRKEHEKILAAMKKLKVDVDTYLCQPNPL